MLCPVNQFLSTYHHTINLIVLMKLDPKTIFLSFSLSKNRIIFPMVIHFILILALIFIFPPLLLITIIIIPDDKTLWMIYSAIVKSTSTNYEHCNCSFLLFFFVLLLHLLHSLLSSSFCSSSNPSNHSKSMIDEIGTAALFQSEWTQVNTQFWEQQSECFPFLFLNSLSYRN